MKPLKQYIYKLHLIKPLSYTARVCNVYLNNKDISDKQLILYRFFFYGKGLHNIHQNNIHCVYQNFILFVSFYIFDELIVDVDQYIIDFSQSGTIQNMRSFSCACQNSHVVKHVTDHCFALKDCVLAVGISLATKPPLRKKK